jgi:hypothetical protein
VIQGRCQSTDISEETSRIVERIDEYPPHRACQLLSRWFLSLLFGPEDGGVMFLRNRRLTFNGLHGVISQKRELFKVNHGSKKNMKLNTAPRRIILPITVAALARTLGLWVRIQIHQRKKKTTKRKRKMVVMMICNFPYDQFHGFRIVRQKRRIFIAQCNSKS